MQFDSQKVFRFRTIDRLLNDRELEDQYIYFANPDELNDPVEGLRNIVWHGDAIVWENFFIHYLRSLQMFVLLFFTTDRNRSLQLDDIGVRRLYART